MNAKETNAFPNWAQVTPEAVAAEMPKLLDEAEKAVSAVEAANPVRYEDFVWALDDATRELWRTWGRISHMLGVMNSAAWRKVEEEWQPKVVAFSLRVGQSARLYDLARRMVAGETGTRQRILKKMVEGAELAGVGLDDARRERFNAIQAQLARLGADFHNAVIDATKAYTYEKDGKTYTIDDAEYPITMKNCADREVREHLCKARATRAPENAVRIAEMLKLRREAAAILGYASYAEMSLASKCAPGVDAVMKMIDALDTATAEIARREDAELGAGLEPWDYAYAAERLREKKYAYSEEELKRHFEFADVLKGLFRMTKFLFGIDVEEVTGAEKPSVWQSDVRFFRVLEKGETVAHFYLDPYVRNGLKSGGAWMNEFRNRRKVKAEGEAVVTPLALVALNLPIPDADGKTYMVWREVETLFHEFGHACQQMLTRVDEEDAAGINLVEWDAVEVASQFMENWCLDDRTGIVVPEELKAKVRAAKNFRAASACRRQLSFAKTDMVLHGAEDVDDANQVKHAVFTHFGIPMVEGDTFLNAFTHIFSGGYSAGYYGYKWSEVMSADLFGAFEEAGLSDDAAMARLGGRYRETVLGMGGSKSALEVFRDFRGREPEITALLRQQGLA